jgi:hypothetical protein
MAFNIDGFMHFLVQPANYRKPSSFRATLAQQTLQPLLKPLLRNSHALTADEIEQSWVQAPLAGSRVTSGKNQARLAQATSLGWACAGDPLCPPSGN